LKVILEGEESRMLNGHIQEILPGGDAAVVYIEEIGRRFVYCPVLCNNISINHRLQSQISTNSLCYLLKQLQ